MKGLADEIAEIPQKAALCWKKNKNIQLPLSVPYLGMGASYDAALTLFYLGKDIRPYIASEYYAYIAQDVQPLGVFISQSGETSETLWAREKFKEIIAVTNHADSALAKSDKAKEVFELYAGTEGFSSTKTYINTLITLYSGLGIPTENAVRALQERWSELQENAEKTGEQIIEYSNGKAIAGRYVIGSGANVATARMGALVLSEISKLAWSGMPVAQYDHGPKETAENSVVVVLNSNGKDAKRILELKSTLKEKSNALVVELSEPMLSEELSPFTLSLQIYFLMNYLAGATGIQEEMLHIGKKITITSNAVKE